MTADPSVLLVRIADLSKDLDQAETVSMLLLVLVVAILVATAWGTYHWDGMEDVVFDVFVITEVAVGITLVVCLGIYAETEVELGTLIDTYEALFGPLPEGIL